MESEPCFGAQHCCAPPAPLQLICQTISLLFPLNQPAGFTADHSDSHNYCRSHPTVLVAPCSSPLALPRTAGDNCSANSMRNEQFSYAPVRVIGH